MSISVTTTPSVCHHSSDEDEDVRYLATASAAAATEESSLGFLDSISTSPADNHTAHSNIKRQNKQEAKLSLG